MMKLSPKLPIFWTTFAKGYGNDLAYWYQPKGLAVTVKGVQDRLRVLKEFEATRPWRECQAAYVVRLNQEGISGAGGTPLARMLKQVMATLGLAWVDPDDNVEFTPAGDALLASNDPASVLAQQSLRYQFWNPVISASVLKPVRLHPVPFLVRLLQAIDGRLSAEEFTLFVAKARTYSDVDTVADQIDKFRQLDAATRRAVVQRCDAYSIGGPKRGSIYNTIRLGRSYGVRMWALSGLFETSKEDFLKLKSNVLRGNLRNYMDDYAANGTYIEFSSEKNFLAWMGDPTLRPTNAVALDVYTAQGDLVSATRIKKELGASPTELREFRRMLISEKTLEDNIVTDFAAFGRQIKRKLVFVDRQYATSVGPIDILATEAGSGGYVVIELKKGRSADKVFGQISRYMGWVRKHLAQGKKVSGIIVGSQIDEKLRSARDAHDTAITLVEYESRVSVKEV